jgi:hypothetical protein
MFDQRQGFLWFNNGADVAVFNAVKSHVWTLLVEMRAYNRLPARLSLGNLEAYCRMAVEMYGVLFREHVAPRDRIVGGGVDSVAIPWPGGAS